MTQELQFLINIIKNKLLKREFHFSTLLSEKLLSKAESNSILPFLSIEDFKHDKYSDLLLNFNRTNTVSNLIGLQEFVRVIKLLNDNNVRFLPYKGHLYLEILYKGAQLREIGDLDFLVHNLDAEKAMDLLLKDGYEMPNSIKNESFKTVFNIKEIYEIALTKNIKSFKSNIDFHWGLIYNFLPYNIDLVSLFENKSSVKINGFDCVSPSDETMFVMLIINHGGRDAWSKLKFIADFLAFMEVKGNKIDWRKMLKTLTEMKLKRATLVGFFLLKQYFDYTIPKIVEEEFIKEKIDIKLTKPIIDYWENGYDIISLKGRIKYERILLSIQDQGFSKLTYLKNMFKTYTIPNPFESKRLITFPDNYYVLNGISKAITYFWNRGFGKIIK